MGLETVILWVAGALGLADAFLVYCLLPSTPNRHTVTSHSLHLFGISASFFFSCLKRNRDKGCPVGLAVQRKLQIHREASIEKRRWQVQTKQKEILLRQHVI